MLVVTVRSSRSICSSNSNRCSDTYSIISLSFVCIAVLVLSSSSKLSITDVGEEARSTWCSITNQAGYIECQYILRSVCIQYQCLSKGIFCSRIDELNSDSFSCVFNLTVVSQIFNTYNDSLICNFTFNLSTCNRSLSSINSSCLVCCKIILHIDYIFHIYTVIQVEFFVDFNFLCSCSYIKSGSCCYFHINRYIITRQHFIVISIFCSDSVSTLSSLNLCFSHTTYKSNTHIIDTLIGCSNSCQRLFCHIGSCFRQSEDGASFRVGQVEIIDRSIGNGRINLGADYILCFFRRKQDIAFLESSSIKILTIVSSLTISQLDVGTFRQYSSWTYCYSLDTGDGSSSRQYDVFVLAIFVRDVDSQLHAIFYIVDTTGRNAQIRLFTVFTILYVDMAVFSYRESRSCSSVTCFTLQVFQWNKISPSSAIVIAYLDFVIVHCNFRSHTVFTCFTFFTISDSVAGSITQSNNNTIGCRCHAGHPFTAFDLAL